MIEVVDAKALRTLRIGQINTKSKESIFSRGSLKYAVGNMVDT